MNNSIRQVVCCLTAVILLVATSGCDWKFPITSPSRAKVDKRLLGYWKATFTSPAGKSETAIITLSECAKIYAPNLAAHPHLPRGAMFMDEIELNKLRAQTDSIPLFWTTRIGNTTYLNHTLYYRKTKKLAGAGPVYMIFKYVVMGDSVTIFDLPGDASKRIKSRLGSDYNSSDLLQEITKATEWKVFVKLDRIRL